MVSTDNSLLSKQKGIFSNKEKKATLLSMSVCFSSFSKTCSSPILFGSSVQYAKKDHRIFAIFEDLEFQLLFFYGHDHNYILVVNNYPRDNYIPS